MPCIGISDRCFAQTSRSVRLAGNPFPCCFQVLSVYVLLQSAWPGASVPLLGGLLCTW